jgi:hypothetical protein
LSELGLNFEDLEFQISKFFLDGGALVRQEFNPGRENNSAK